MHLLIPRLKHKDSLQRKTSNLPYIKKGYCQIPYVIFNIISLYKNGGSSVLSCIVTIQGLCIEVRTILYMGTMYVLGVKCDSWFPPCILTCKGPKKGQSFQG